MSWIPHDHHQALGFAIRAERSRLRPRLGLDLSQVRSVESLISMDGSGAAADFGGPGDGNGDCGGDLEERSQSFQ